MAEKKKVTKKVQPKKEVNLEKKVKDLEAKRDVLNKEIEAANKALEKKVQQDLDKPFNSSYKKVTEIHGNKIKETVIKDGKKTVTERELSDKELTAMLHEQAHRMSELERRIRSVERHFLGGWPFDL